MKVTSALDRGIQGIQGMIEEIQRRPYAVYPETKLRREALVKEYRAAQVTLKALVALIEGQS